MTLSTFRANNHAMEIILNISCTSVYNKPIYYLFLYIDIYEIFNYKVLIIYSNFYKFD